jgi:hypothetical protein
MRRVPGTLYSVCEDDNYTQHFCKLDDVRTKAVNEITGVPVHFKLYRVSCPNDSINPIMVLADSPSRAIGQATCERDRSFEEQREIEKTLVAELVPFKIQGWSSNRF